MDGNQVCSFGQGSDGMDVMARSPAGLMAQEFGSDVSCIDCGDELVNKIEIVPVPFDLYLLHRPQRSARRLLIHSQSHDISVQNAIIDFLQKWA